MECGAPLLEERNECARSIEGDKDEPLHETLANEKAEGEMHEPL